jgi:mono/diheme cytochrome c family protein
MVAYANGTGPYSSDRGVGSKGFVIIGDIIPREESALTDASIYRGMWAVVRCSAVSLFGAMLAIMFANGTSHAQDNGAGVMQTPYGTVTTAKLQFRKYCASCHGISGEGDGPVADSLKKRPPDLTVLSRDNGGKFPEQRVYDAIAGTGNISAHGTREMPIWGMYFQRPNSALGAGGPMRNQQQVKNHIMIFVNYIKSIQKQ